MANGKVRIGLVQSRVTADIGENLKKTARMIEEAKKKGAQIVCLQELFSTLYFAQEEDKKLYSYAQSSDGKTAKWLQEQAKKNHVVLVGGSIFESTSDKKRFNTTLIFDEKGKEIGKYRKTHIPQDPHFYEQFYFEPGDTGYIQVKSDGITFAPLICYDQWFPEAARSNVLSGAQLLFYPTAIGWLDYMKKKEPFSAQRWEDAMRSHASLNGIFVAAVNRVGKEGKIDFWGGSFIADPYGQIIAKASSSEEEVLVADIDLSLIHESQEGWGFLRNRKPSSYNQLLKKHEQ